MATFSSRIQGVGFRIDRREVLRYNASEERLITSVREDIEIRAIRDMQTEVQRATIRAAHAGKEYAQTFAPEGETGELKRAIEARPTRIPLSSADQRPEAAYFYAGGAGGGGSYQASVSVNTMRAPYAGYLLQGTGIYGEKRQRIRYGKEIKFFWWKQKRPMRVFEIAGTPVDSRWWDGAHDAVQAELNRSLPRLRVAGLSNVR